MKKNFFDLPFQPAIILSLALLLFSSCGPKEKTASSPQTSKPQTTQSISAGEFNLEKEKVPTISLEDHSFLPIRSIDGKDYVSIEGLLTQESFNSFLSNSKSQRIKLLKNKLKLIQEKLASQASLTQVSFSPEVGYFRALASLEKINIRKKYKTGKDLLRELFPLGTGDQDMILGPLVHTSSPVPLIPHQRELDKNNPTGSIPKKNQENDKNFNDPLNYAGFSGLQLMKVEEFVEIVEKELNPHADNRSDRKVRVNGSSIKLGVTDTGITYNHPTFLDDQGKNRVAYMKDFTGEGRVYFHPKAKFDIRLPTSEDSLPEGADTSNALFLNAEIFPPTKGINRPFANQLNEIKNKLLLVSPQLKAILTSPGSGAKLGAISEASFSNDVDKVDINQNGTADDVLWMIFLPQNGENLAQIFVNTEGKLDFQKSPSLTDWNRSKKTLLVHSERIGFILAEDELIIETSQPTIEPHDPSQPNGDLGNNDLEGPKTQTVMSASMVGFDPGNHGTHVAGIAAGRKTISNDNDETKARGVAPSAQIYMNRVCANSGGCMGHQAIIDLAQQGVDLINMSLGGLSNDNDGYDPESVLIDRLSQLYQVQFVISAGNSGPGHQTVGSPSISRWGLSIGAAATPAMIKRQLQFTALPPYKDSQNASSTLNSEEDFILYFSSRGPSGAGGFKPELTAPGSQLSSIPFNVPAEEPTAGINSYWGTSMSAPAASGAYALLLDAARKYNQLNPEHALPTSPWILKHVLLESARPFSIKKNSSQGLYTWIDQGMGMINLPQAWKILKLAKNVKGHATFSIPEVPLDELPDPSISGGEVRKIPVILDYEVKTSQSKGRNEGAYDGTGTAPKFARGLWIDSNSQQSLYKVSIKRNIPQNLLQRSDAAHLLKILRDTSADQFKLKLDFQGTELPWAKITDHANPCNEQAGKEEVHISSMGENAWSNLYVCVHTGIMKTLPPGDHGLIIKGFKTVNGYTWPIPSFIIPVYLTVPHKVLAQAKSSPSISGDESSWSFFQVNGTVRSFEVKKHYIEVPQGVSMVKLSLEVPPSTLSENGNITGCSGINFIVHEGSNTQHPPELEGTGKASAKSCDDLGNPLSEGRVISYHRMNPRPGMWDLHLLGLFRFPLSAYTLRVDYNKLTSTHTEIVGPPELLQGQIKIKIEESTSPVLASASKSQFFLNGLQETNTFPLTLKEVQTIPGTRQYGIDTSSVVFKTGKAKGENIDIDLYIYECTVNQYDIEEKNCKKISESTSASFTEEVRITPLPDKFYFARVEGFSVPATGTQYEFQEIQYLKNEDKGELQFLQNDGESLIIAHKMIDDRLLKNAGFLAGKYSLLGEIKINAEDLSPIAIIPVTISKKVEPTP